jgi:hypothetical protein
MMEICFFIHVYPTSAAQNTYEFRTVIPMMYLSMGILDLDEMFAPFGGTAGKICLMNM